MLVIGLTGTIGSGKTTVAQILARNGIPVLSSDDIANQIIEHDPGVRTKLRQLFGPDVVPDGPPINRQLLASRIFGPSDEHAERRRIVEQLVHPRVLEQIAATLDELASQQTELAVVESALIFQAGIEDLFDYVVAVVAPTELRRQRACERGNNAADFDMRNAAQLDDEELARRADFVIDNSGTLRDLEHATEALISILKHLPPRPVEHRTPAHE
jgi:dephospho-CoA kinase